jgi:hypothetical protein
VRVSCFDNVREVGLSLSLTEDGLVTENLHTHILFGPSSSRTCTLPSLCVCVCVSNVTRLGYRSGRRRFQSVSYCRLGLSIHRYLVAPPLSLLEPVLRQKVECNIAHKCRHLAPFFRLFWAMEPNTFDIILFSTFDQS